MFWICAEHKVDNEKMLLLTRAYTDPKAFSAFGTATLVRQLWVHGRQGGDTGTFQTVWHPAQYIQCGGGRKGLWEDIWNWCFVFPSHGCVMGPC